MASSTVASQVKPTSQGQTSSSTNGATASSTMSFSAAAGRQRGAVNGATSRAAKQQQQQSEPRPTSTSTTTDTSNSDKHAHDRLLFLLASFVGHLTHITVSNGDQFTGIFSAASLPDSGEPHRYILKMVKQQHQASKLANGDSPQATTYTGFGEDHVMVFDMKDVVQFNVQNVSTDKIQAKLTNGKFCSVLDNVR